MLTRDDFLAPPPRRFRTVMLPDGREARIRNLTELEKSEFEASVLDAKCELSPRELRKHRMRLIIACLVDQQGNPLLSDADLPKLAKLDGAVTARLHDECRKHCGFAAEDIEELVKNSAAIAASDLPTDSA